MQVPDARSLEPKAQEALRLRVAAAVARGMGKSEAARVFEVSRQAVRLWVRRAEEGGRGALRGKKRGRPSQPRLGPDAARRAARLIRDRCPDQLWLPFALWTRGAVRELLRRRFGVRVSVWTVGRYLREWGFTPQKPMRRAFERDERAVRKWLREQYPRVRSLAKREKARILWGDEMGLRSDHQAGRSWAPRGETPVIPGTGRRFGCNMISAIGNRGELYFLIFRDAFTTAVFLRFLTRLLRQHRRKIFLVLDGHPVHRSRAIQRWLGEQRNRLRIFFLPPYAPDLNPDELLNQDVKTNAAGRRRPATQAQMIGNVRGYLRATQNRPEIVRSYFREEHVRYAAA